MTVLLQGVQYSAASVNNIAFGVPVTGLKAINWDREQNKELQYNLANEPMGVTFNQIAYSGSITVIKEWWNAVIQAAPNKDVLQIPPFDWTITYGNLNTPATVETLKMVMFTKDGMKVASGDTSLTIDIPFIFAGVERPL